MRREARARGAATDRDRLRTAHGIIASAVRPVYSVDDLRRVSRTLRLGRGSCSQRMAVLEAVARSLGVPTRVRGLLVDGAFWYPRFPGLRPSCPRTCSSRGRSSCSTGPGSRWPTSSRTTGRAGRSGRRRSGRGRLHELRPETLFEAVARTAVDWDAPPACAGSAPCDLSAHLRTDLGRFTSRDELFARHGQTLCLAARTLAEPVLGRWSAGAGASAKSAGGRAAA